MTSNSPWTLLLHDGDRTSYARRTFVEGPPLTLINPTDVHGLVIEGRFLLREAPGGGRIAEYELITFLKEFVSDAVPKLDEEEWVMPEAEESA